MADHNQLLGLATDIVSAHVSHNSVNVDQLPKLIQQVVDAMNNAERVIAELPKPVPAVSVKQSVVADHIACLDCGKHFSILKRHLMTDHKLTPEQYRQRWGLPFSYPLAAPNYPKTRSTLAKECGLGKEAKAPAEKKAARKKAQVFAS
jgi:predicted transcriptional regulator